MLYPLSTITTSLSENKLSSQTILLSDAFPPQTSEAWAINPVGSEVMLNLIAYVPENETETKYLIGKENKYIF